MMYFGWGGMWIIPLIVLGLLVAGIYLAFSRISVGPQWHDTNRGTRYSSESALEILKKRYASGEIDKEEFDRMKEDILS